MGSLASTPGYGLDNQAHITVPAWACSLEAVHVFAGCRCLGVVAAAAPQNAICQPAGTRRSARPNHGGIGGDFTDPDTSGLTRSLFRFGPGKLSEQECSCGFASRDHGDGSSPRMMISEAEPAIPTRPRSGGDLRVLVTRDPNGRD